MINSSHRARYEASAQYREGYNDGKLDSYEGRPRATARGRSDYSEGYTDGYGTAVKTVRRATRSRR